MTRTKTAFGIAPLLALASFASGASANPLSYSNDTGGSALAYGQLSPAYLSVDDGKKTTGNFVDNAHSNTRAGLWLRQSFQNDTELSFNFETALGAPQSSSFSQDFSPNWKWEKSDIRKVEIIFAGNFGKVSAGQGSMATDGAAERDLSGTGMAAYSVHADTAGGFFFRQKDGELGGVTVGNAFTDFDGPRRGRVRYDTPMWSGFSLAGAYGENVLNDDDDAKYYDVAALYSSEVNDVKLSGAAGYAWKDDDDVTETYMGSFSVLHSPTGLNASIAAGGQQSGGNYGYGKLGWIANFFDIGSSNFSIDYYSGDGIANDGSKSEAIQFGALQKFDDINLEAYLGLAEYRYDDDAADYKNMQSVLAGLRWKF